MRKFIIKHAKLLVSVLLVFLIVLGLVEIFHFSKIEKEQMKKRPVNNYIFSRENIEVPGTETYTNEVLQNPHCLDSICITGATFYYIGDSGRVDYTIENHSNQSATGYLKMNFGDNHLIIAYRSVPANGKVTNTSQYVNVTFSSKEDYSLEALTEEELNRLVID